MHVVAREINGYWLADKEIVDPKTQGRARAPGRRGSWSPRSRRCRPTARPRAAPGSTAAPTATPAKKDGEALDPKTGNKMAKRGKEDPTGLGLYPNWSWSWPVNRRIVYNRASVDEYGQPWDAEAGAAQVGAGRGPGDQGAEEEPDHRRRRCSSGPATSSTAATRR